MSKPFYLSDGSDSQRAIAAGGHLLLPLCLLLIAAGGAYSITWDDCNLVSE